MLVKDPAIIWNSLKGIICVYKPAFVATKRVRAQIISKICSELNEMDGRPPTDYVSIEGNPSSQLAVKVQQSLADHPLVVGPRYQLEDIKCSWSNFLGHHTSGVLLLGLREGTKHSKFIRENRSVRTYRLKGCFGQATEGGFAGEKVVERSTWRHVKESSVKRLLCIIQTSHQKQMFKMSGFDIQSQAAYEMAVQSPIRPSNSKLPVIYGIKCVEFQPPEFTVELHCVNEYETYLKSLIHEIGIKLHSTAHCTGIQCIRHSYFTLDDALLTKHWTLQNIVTNVEKCTRIIDENENIIRQKSAALLTMNATN